MKFRFLSLLIYFIDVKKRWTRRKTKIGLNTFENFLFDLTEKQSRKNDWVRFSREKEIQKFDYQFEWASNLTVLILTLTILLKLMGKETLKCKTHTYMYCRTRRHLHISYIWVLSAHDQLWSTLTIVYKLCLPTHKHTRLQITYDFTSDKCRRQFNVKHLNCAKEAAAAALDDKKVNAREIDREMVNFSRATVIVLLKDHNLKNQWHFPPKKMYTFSVNKQNPSSHTKSCSNPIE